MMSIKLRETIYILSIILPLLSCNSENKSIESFYSFDYDYELRSFYSDDLKNHKSAQFFKDGNLIRRIDRDGGCEVFHYDSTEQLIESIWGRNCNYGRRTILIFDSLNNHIGYYRTMDSVIDIDTVEFEQTLFYDSDNRSIKERIEKRKLKEGQEFETWKFYTYSDSLIQTETTITNGDTVWIAEYSYDSANRIVKIHRVKNGLYEIENYKYNEDGELLEKKKVSTKNPVTANTFHSADNYKRVYEYDTEKILKSETVLNHKDEVVIKTIYKKIKKKTSHKMGQ